MARNIILFTGQSGLNSKQSITSFIEKCPRFSSNPEKRPLYYKIEDYIDKLYRKDNEITPEHDRSAVWISFLKDPYTNQERYWKRALNEIFKDMSLSKNKDRSVFINMHLCYYHRKTKEYISLLDPEFIRELRNKKNKIKIITLIDDIYDIHDRLRKNTNDIFYPRVQRTAIDIVLEYLIILQWRAKEIMFSRFLGKILNCKQYVFAIKHNWDTLYNLIFDKAPTAYFSHPISEVRRLEGVDDKEAEDIRNQISDFSDELRVRFAPFLPTTIDEFRILEKEKILYPKLKLRWEFDKYEDPQQLLYSASLFEKEKNELWNDKGENHDSKDFMLVLKTLNDSIGTQVTTRDYALVEQSKYLIVYRPLYNGNASGGVKKETEYHNDLLLLVQSLDDGQSTIPVCYVYCPLQDIALYKKNTFNFFVREKIKAGRFISREGASEFTSITEEEANELFLLDNNQKKLENFLKDKVLHQHGIQIADDPNLKSSAPLKDNDEAIDNIYAELVKQYMEKTKEAISFYKKFTKDFPDHKLFDNKKFIAKIKTGRS